MDDCVRHDQAVKTHLFSQDVGLHFADSVAGTVAFWLTTFGTGLWRRPV